MAQVLSEARARRRLAGARPPVAGSILRTAIAPHLAAVRTRPRLRRPARAKSRAAVPGARARAGGAIQVQRDCVATLAFPQIRQGGRVLNQGSRGAAWSSEPPRVRKNPSKIRCPKANKTHCFAVMRPAPLSKTPAISRFSRRARSRFTFCAKRQEIAARLGRMGRGDGGGVLELRSGTGRRGAVSAPLPGQKVTCNAPPGPPPQEDRPLVSVDPPAGWRIC
jgi:hypothetical protein